MLRCLSISLSVCSMLYLKYDFIAHLTGQLVFKSPSKHVCAFIRSKARQALQGFFPRCLSPILLHSPSFSSPSRHICPLPAQGSYSFPAFNIPYEKIIAPSLLMQSKILNNSVIFVISSTIKACLYFSCAYFSLFFNFTVYCQLFDCMVASVLIKYLYCRQ